MWLEVEDTVIHVGENLRVVSFMVTCASTDSMICTAQQARISSIMVSWPGSRSATMSRTLLKSGYGDFWGSTGKDKEKQELDMFDLLSSLRFVTATVFNWCWCMCPYTVHRSNLAHLFPSGLLSPLTGCFNNNSRVSKYVWLKRNASSPNHCPRQIYDRGTSEIIQAICTISPFDLIPYGKA